MHSKKDVAPTLSFPITELHLALPILAPGHNTRSLSSTHMLAHDLKCYQNRRKPPKPGDWLSLMHTINIFPPPTMIHRNESRKNMDWGTTGPGLCKDCRCAFRISPDAIIILMVLQDTITLKGREILDGTLTCHGGRPALPEDEMPSGLSRNGGVEQAKGHAD